MMAEGVKPVYLLLTFIAGVVITGLILDDQYRSGKYEPVMSKVDIQELRELHDMCTDAFNRMADIETCIENRIKYLEE